MDDLGPQWQVQMTDVYIFSPLCFLMQTGQSVHIFTWSFFFPFLVSQPCSSFYYLLLKTIKSPLCQPLCLWSKNLYEDRVLLTWTLLRTHQGSHIPTASLSCVSCGETLLSEVHLTFNLGKGQSKNSQAVARCVCSGRNPNKASEKAEASCVVALEWAHPEMHMEVQGTLQKEEQSWRTHTSWF